MIHIFLCLQPTIYQVIMKKGDQELAEEVIIDKINPPAAITNESDRKQKIMDMAGKYDFCEEAVNELRIESMI